MKTRTETDDLISGIYLVTLNTEEPISVNAHDRRIAHKSIKVTRRHCKVGRAVNLSQRCKNYQKTFGAENVNFMVLFTLDECQRAERAILARLDAYRIRGLNGRKNEWLDGISAEEVKQIVKDVIRQL